MYDLITDLNEHDWKALTFPGVAMKLLHTNPETGGTIVATKMDAGAEFPAHHHALADETVYVLEGDFIENGVAYRQGTLFFAAAGSVHGPHRTESGCTVLIQFSKTHDFVLD